MSDSVQSPKVLIVTALITAMTTIGVAFIGIFPQLRSGDVENLKKLQKDLETVKQQASITVNAKENTSTSPGKKMTINGTVRSEDGKRTLSGVDVYLLPEGNNLLTAKTDDTGRFTLQEIPPGIYSIIVRDSLNGKSGKGLLDDSGDEVKVIGASIKYRIHK